MVAKGKLVLSFIFVCIVSIFAVGAQPAFAQAGYPDMQTLLFQVSVQIDQLHNEGYDVANVYFDRLTLGSSYQMTRNLYGGNDYKIVGLGENGIADLDLKVTDSFGNSTTDISQDAVPMISGSVTRNDVYAIETNLYSVYTDVDATAEFYFATIIAFKSTKAKLS